MTRVAGRRREMRHRCPVQRVRRKGLSSLTVSVLDDELVDELQPELTGWIHMHGELMVVCGVLQLLARRDSGVKPHPLIAGYKVAPALRNAMRSPVGIESGLVPTSRGGLPTA